MPKPISKTNPTHTNVNMAVGAPCTTVHVLSPESSNCWDVHLRLHQRTCQGILEELDPELGSTIIQLNG